MTLSADPDILNCKCDSCKQQAAKVMASLVKAIEALTDGADLAKGAVEAVADALKDVAPIQPQLPDRLRQLAGSVEAGKMPDGAAVDWIAVDDDGELQVHLRRVDKPKEQEPTQ